MNAAARQLPPRGRRVGALRPQLPQVLPRPCPLRRAPGPRREGPRQCPPTLAMTSTQVPHHCLSAWAPTHRHLEGAVGSAQQLLHNRAIAAHRSTDAAFISRVTDGGSIWGLFIQVFFPWLLLLLSSIFNFPINRRVVLFPLFALLESPSHGWGLPPPWASAGREGLGRGQRFQPLPKESGIGGHDAWSLPPLIHSFM